MADSEISMLPATDGVTDDTLIPVYQPGTTEPAQRMNGKQFAEFAMKQVQEDLDELSEKVSQLSEEIGDGLSAEEKTLMLALFKNAAYIADMSATVTQLETLWGSTGDDTGGEDSGDTGEDENPEVTKYTIALELVNVSSSNSATSVNDGAGYTATLTAYSGYELSTVTVLMGGVDITATAYSGGAVTIASVTGNVEIMASASVVEESEPELIEDGLLAYFDFRNIAGTSGNGSTGYYIPATQGSGALYSWYPASAGNEYGLGTKDRTYCSGSSFSAHNFGTEFTWILKSYCDVRHSVWGLTVATPTNFGTTIAPTYNTDDSTATATSTTLDKVEAGYHDFTLRVSGASLKVYVDAELAVEYDGSTIDGFVSWVDTLKVGDSWASGETQKCNTALVTYSRALDETEIVEMVEYLKTLEVA